jgi:HK97 family phage major capsid protein
MNKKLRELINAQNTILNKAIAENRALTDEENKEIERLEGEVENVKKVMDLQARVSKNKGDEEELEKEEKKPVNDKIFAEPKNANESKWKHVGEFLMSVKNASDPFGSVDNRLLKVSNATGLNEQVNSEGGFLVEETMVKELMKNTYAQSQVASRARKLPLGANSNRITIPGIDETSRANGSRWGGVNAYWTGEAQTVTASKPKFRKISLELEKLMALCYATDELLADATALEAYIRMAFGDEMSFKLDDAVINGTGAGMPLGILNAPCTIEVSKEANQPAATIIHQNISKMWKRLWAPNRANAVWFVNQDVEDQLTDMTFSVGTGGELSTYAKEYNEKGTIKGRPVIPIEQCQTLGTVGDIILADMNQYLMIEKGGLDAQVSMHVRFLYDEQVFRFIYRADGEPTLASALSPKNGSTTYSPFIKLQTR